MEDIPSFICGWGRTLLSVGDSRLVNQILVPGGSMEEGLASPAAVAVAERLKGRRYLHGREERPLRDTGRRERECGRWGRRGVSIVSRGEYSLGPPSLSDG